MQNSWHVCEQPAPNQRTAPVCGCMTNPGDQPHQDLDKTAMDSSLEFWEEKWERNHTPWHMREAHP